jgi:DNA-binding CsgD family transcriptional regulator
MALIALTVTDRRTMAISRFDQVLANLSRAGALWAYGANLAFRGWALLRFGQLRDAEADLRSALDERYGAAAGVTGPLAVGSLIETMLEREGLAAASTVMSDFADVEANSAAPSDPLVQARARVALACKQPRQALAELESSKTFELEFGGRCPGWSPWRLIAVRAHLAIGDSEAARALAAEHYEHTVTFGGANVIGAALHCRALAEDSVTLLREAEVALGRSSSRLQHAHALVDLGAVLRSRRQLLEARDPLRAGLDLAMECGARPLAERAREELAIAGGRPRRLRSTGIDALTPAELRAARLAADGLTNREIAQAGFVSPRTVEMHLSNAYGKLGISTRAQLRELMPDLNGRLGTTTAEG